MPFDKRCVSARLSRMTRLTSCLNKEIPSPNITGWISNQNPSSKFSFIIEYTAVGPPNINILLLPCSPGCFSLLISSVILWPMTYVFSELPGGNVVDRTYLGTLLYQFEYLITAFVAPGFSAAVGQSPFKSSYAFRPKRAASAVSVNPQTKSRFSSPPIKLSNSPLGPATKPSKEVWATRISFRILKSNLVSQNYLGLNTILYSRDYHME